MMQRGNPEGSPNLFRGPEFYRPKLTPWMLELRRYAVYYPLLALCEGQIVEFGCGGGTLGRMALDLGHDYHCGLDFSPEAIRIARYACPEAFFFEVNLKDWRCRADVEWHVKHAGTIAMPEVLEHVEDDLGVLRQLPQGMRVALSVPSFHSDGHGRWFSHCGQAVARYRALLDIQVAFEEKSASQGQRRVFLLKGWRR